MRKREKLGVLPPKIDGYDPDEAKIRWTYWRALLQHKAVLALVFLLVLGTISGMTYFDVHNRLAGYFEGLEDVTGSSG